MKRIVIACALAFSVVPATAQEGPPPPLANQQLADPAQEARALELMQRLRCIQCQGQSIHDSDAPIAAAMRHEVRERIKVYGWIGGDKPADVVAGAAARRAQGFTAVKMNGTDGVDWIDSPALLDETAARVREVRALGLDVGIDFHGRVHKGMAKQLARVLEPLQPLFIEGRIIRGV